MASSSVLLQLLDKAIQCRLDLGLPAVSDDCFRLFDGSGDGMEGLEIDVLAGHWIVGTRNISWPQGIEQLALQKGALSVWQKQLSVEEKGDLVWRAGVKQTERFLGIENAMKFWFDLQAGYSQGLFLDQRLNRKQVRTLVAEQVAAGGDVQCLSKEDSKQADFLSAKEDSQAPRVLNLFAYTGGFSVAAALAGAKVTTLDLSQRYLSWAKENFLLNGLSVEEHWWVRGDALEWLQKWAKSGRRFHGIVVDPPTFSRLGKKSWSVERDLAKLAAAVEAILEPNGWVFLSTNCRKLEKTAFLRQLHFATKQLDWEYAPMPPEFNGEHYLQAAWGRTEAS